MSAIGTLRLPVRARRSRPSAALPRLSPRLELARAVFVLVAILAGSLVVQFAVLSSVQQRAAQQRAFDRFRSELARGVAPVGPTDAAGHPLALGAPVAYLEIPRIGLRQVIGEGTTSSALFAGPGHRRDTVLPGQAGTSVVFGRRAAFGGPFARIGDLARGALVHVTTGQGAFDFRVLDVRRAGDRAPAALPAAHGRLVLTTADGRPFAPSGVLRVDADLTKEGATAPARLLSAPSLPASEQPMGIDGGTVWALALWLQAMLVVLLAGVWAWHRWSRPRAWVVLLPPLLFVFLSASGEAARLFPNLL